MGLAYDSDFPLEIEVFFQCELLHTHSTCILCRFHSSWVTQTFTGRLAGGAFALLGANPKVVIVAKFDGGVIVGLAGCVKALRCILQCGALVCSPEKGLAETDTKSGLAG
jgi:hypothetical protein